MLKMKKHKIENQYANKFKLYKKRHWSKWYNIHMLAFLFGGLMTFTCISQGKSAQITDIDKNFRTAKVNNLKVNYHNALIAPFVVEGFPWEKTGMTFFRIPPDFTKKEVTGGTLWLARLTAGGAIRFRSDSPYITLRAELAYSADMNHMPRAASAGFDLYSGSGKKIWYVKTAQPSRDQKVLELVLINDGSKTMRDWTLYLPLYGSATKVEIGIAPGAKIQAPTPHAILKSIVFYGSSITQGACASRPGNAYTTMLCRAVDAPQINLGFSGNALGEPAMAKAIATLNPAVFILDYDHNAPTVEHLAKTHEPFFRIIRAQHPDIPIIIISRCNFYPRSNDIRRREIIRKTFKNAVKNGDKKVWFIDGEKLFGYKDRDACTTDGTHPNDLGFYRMYRQILPVLRQSLKQNNE